MIFYTKIDRFERKSGVSKDLKEFTSDHGSEVGKTYKYKIVDGIKTLVEDGEVNYQNTIDAYADCQDINIMIQKFINGDTSVINPSSGTYGDFTSFPKTYAEMFETIQNCKNVFDEMPKEIREKFDNSAEKFWSSFGSKYFDEIFEEYNKKFNGEPDPIPEIKVESEVKVDE